MRFFSRNQLEQARKELLAWNPLLKIEKLGVNQDAGTANRLLLEQSLYLT